VATSATWAILYLGRDSHIRKFPSVVIAAPRGFSVKNRRGRNTVERTLALSACCHVPRKPAAEGRDPKKADSK
jgi:hypothetical protein